MRKYHAPFWSSGRQSDLPIDCNKLREQVERFFNHLKQFRCIATRYEKLSQTFLAWLADRSYQA